MEIVYIELSNIGPYVGVHHFDFNTTLNRNIVLIGCKNDASRTIFLKSLKYALFGCFALGLKTETEQYFKEIKSILNNAASDNFYIKIKFNYVENFKTISYVFIRKWIINNDKIYENLKVEVNDKVLSNKEALEIVEKIKVISSPELIYSCIFEGDKIANKIVNGEISSLLEETFNTIFNINLIKQTNKNLTTYLEKNKVENKSQKQIDNISIIKKIESLKNEIKILNNNLNSLEEEENNLRNIKKSSMSEFYSLGDINEEQQNKIKEKVDYLTKTRNEANKEIRIFLETDFPIFICGKVLNNVIKEIKLEDFYKYNSYTWELEEMTSVGYKWCLDEFREMIATDQDDYIEANYNDRDPEYWENYEPYQKIYDDDYAQYLNKKTIEVVNCADKIKKILNDKSFNLDVYRLLKSKINKKENASRLKEILTINEKIDKELNGLEEQKQSVYKKIELKQKELNLLYLTYEKSNKNLKKKNISNYSYKLTNKYIMICETFIEEIRKEKFKEVADCALDIFNEILRKKGFLSKIVIDSNFNLELYNNKDLKIDSKKLSNGEIQILISSLIWAMFKTSNRKGIFIFDTPLTRLDTENSENFITKIISTIGSQVIILSTESEIVGENIKIIEDKINHKYLLNYDLKNEVTSVEKGLF